MSEAPPSPCNDIVNDDDDEYLKSDVPVSNRSLDPPMVAAMPLEEAGDDEESTNVIQAHAIVEDDSQLNPSCNSASASFQNVPMNVEAVQIDEAPEEEEEEIDQHKPQPKRRYYKWFGILFAGLILGAVLASIPAILRSRRSSNENEEANDGATDEELVPSVAPFSCPSLQHSKTRSFSLDGISFDYFDVTPNVAVLSSPMSPLADAYFATLPFESNITRSGHDDNYDILKLLLLDDDRLLVGLSSHTTDDFGNENRTADAIVIMFYNNTTLEWENKGLILLEQNDILLDLASNKFGSFFAAIVLDESELPALQFVNISEPGEALFSGQFSFPTLSNNSKIHISQQNLLVVYTDDGYLQLFDGSTGLMRVEENLDLGANVEEDGMLIMDDLQASESFDVFLVFSNLPGTPCYVASRTTKDSVPLWAPLLPNATIQMGSLSSSGKSLVLATSHLESDQSRNVASIYRRDDGNDWSVIEVIELVNGTLRGVFLDDDDRMVVVTNDILQVYQLDCVHTTDDVPSLTPSHGIDDTLPPSAAPSCQSTFESVDSSPVEFEGNRFDRVVITSKQAVFAYGQQGYFQTYDYDGATISVTDSFHDQVYDIISMELAMDKLVLALSEYDMNTLVGNMTVRQDAVVVLKRNDTTWEPMASIILGFENQFLQVVSNANGNFFAGVTISTDFEATSLQFASVNQNDESIINSVGQFSMEQLSRNTLISMSQKALLVVYTDDGLLRFFDGETGLFEYQGFIKLGAEIPDGESLVMDDLQSSDSFDVFMVLSHTPDTPVYVGSRRGETWGSKALWVPNRPNATKQMGSLSSDGASLVLATSYSHDGKNRNVASIYRSQDWTRVVETIELMTGELRGIHLADDRMVVATNDMLQVYQVECVVT